MFAAIRRTELLGSRCVEAIKFCGVGKLARRLKVAAEAATFNGYENTCEGRTTLSFKPSDDVVGIVPSGLMFILVSNTRVEGEPAASLSVKPG